MRYAAFVATLLFAPLAEAQSLSDLSWLKGCWRAQSAAGATITEVWTAPPMPAMLGYSYAVHDGQLRGWEQTRVEMIDGWPYFVAMPEGGAAVRFRMRAAPPAGAQSAAFDNPEHDFPQTVSYARDGDALTAVVSGAGGENPITFSYRRIRCPAGLRP